MYNIVYILYILYYNNTHNIIMYNIIYSTLDVFTLLSLGSDP